MEKQININKNIGYIKMNDESTIFYTIVDNNQKNYKKIPAYLLRRFGRGPSLSSRERFDKKRIEVKNLYLKNVHDYLQLFITDNITDNINEIVFDHERYYSDFIKSEKIFYNYTMSNITITSNITY